MWGLLFCRLKKGFSSWPPVALGRRGRSEHPAPRSLWGRGDLGGGASPQKGNRGCEEGEEWLSVDAQNIPGQGNESSSESAPPPCFHSRYCSMSLPLCLSPFPLNRVCGLALVQAALAEKGSRLLSMEGASFPVSPVDTHHLLLPSSLPTQHRWEQRSHFKNEETEAQRG